MTLLHKDVSFLFTKLFYPSFTFLRPIYCPTPPAGSAGSRGRHAQNLAHPGGTSPGAPRGGWGRCVTAAGSLQPGEPPACSVLEDECLPPGPSGSLLFLCCFSSPSDGSCAGGRRETGEYVGRHSGERTSNQRGYSALASRFSGRWQLSVKSWVECSL